MNPYDKILEISEHELIKLSNTFRQKLHTHLVLGQTRYVCRYGTLSDGHEKLTDAQRYYQAIKEMWALSGSIQTHKIEAKFSEADLLEGKEELEKAKSPAEKLRAEAKIERATLRVANYLTQAEDLLRQLDEYNKVRLELAPRVEAQYPEGIEQAEADNWKAVAYYRYLKSEHERMDNVPMSPEDKARLGFQYHRRDMVAPLIVSDGKKAKDLETLFTADQTLIEGKAN